MNFKTNIHCSGCVAKVTPLLDETLGKENWKVDTNDPGKILSVSKNIDATKVIEAVQKAGYRAEAVADGTRE